MVYHGQTQLSWSNLFDHDSLSLNFIKITTAVILFRFLKGNVKILIGALCFYDIGHIKTYIALMDTCIKMVIVDS